MEVLIVVAIMAVIAGGATMLVFPAYKRAKVESAKVGATQVKQAALLWQSEADGDGCPTVKDLVDDKKLEARRTDDPFGTPYRVVCEDEEADDLHTYSNGRDKKEASPDDIRDDFKKADIDRVAEL